jgi:hypothetical protein
LQAIEGVFRIATINPLILLKTSKNAMKARAGGKKLPVGLCLWYYFKIVEFFYFRYREKKT